MADPAYIHLNSPARNGFAVTPSDSTDFTAVPRALWVGVGGDIVGILQGDSATVTIKNVASGALVPLAFKRVYSTGTSATYMVGVY